MFDLGVFGVPIPEPQNPCVECARAPSRVLCSDPGVRALGPGGSATANTERARMLSPSCRLTVSSPCIQQLRIQSPEECSSRSSSQFPNILANAKNVSNTDSNADAAARSPQLRIN
ncbi:hypothetical protein PGTUg99_008763 [Puccinia graminis f. sp. tritici]|uniref:Uncharacterized protein n=1 Tax=Puccinia graminis f. sp. tritici TaxID=56615 RepID=A0A5B0PPW3_PUCGR|nr:hypothetical protein PGTUg99_008763 [Puccinia graminis f. sp. tritici]